jgi:hypothetical protein
MGIEKPIFIFGRIKNYCLPLESVFDLRLSDCEVLMFRRHIKQHEALTGIAILLFVSQTLEQREREKFFHQVQFQKRAKYY